MEDQLITFETAKLAYKKGYDEPSRITYNKDQELLTGWTHDMYNSRFKTSYVAPTQSLLQKWLREVHNIHIHISRVYEWSTETPKFEGYCLYIDFINTVGYEDKVREINSKYLKNLFTDFEEALEEGLQTALNYLK